MIKLNSGFSDYSADDLADLGEAVATNLAALVIFAGLLTTPAMINAAVLALREAIMKTGPGREQAIDAAFDALAALLADVAVNAPKVVGATDTDVAAIGLPMPKPHVRATEPPAGPSDLRLRHGLMPGEILGTCDSLGPNIRSYILQWTLDPINGPWTDAGSFPNSRALKISGLTRGKDIWVRVAAVNTIGQGPWSDPATIMVT